MILTEFRGKRRFWRELVVHFLEWTTGSFDFDGNQGKATILSELVVHSPEWATGSSVFAGNQGKAAFLCVLVVHFPDWTTGSSDSMEKTTIIAAGFLHTKKPASRACWLAIKVENLLGQALPLGLN